MGGFTECLRVARAAELARIDVAAHFMPYLAIHLAAAAPNVVWVEHLPLIEHVFGGLPALDEKGCAVLGDKPGFGLPWDDAIEREFAVPAQ